MATSSLKRLNAPGEHPGPAPDLFTEALLGGMAERLKALCCTLSLSPGADKAILVGTVDDEPFRVSRKGLRHFSSRFPAEAKELLLEFITGERTIRAINIGKGGRPELRAP